MPTLAPLKRTSLHAGFSRAGLAAALALAATPALAQGVVVVPDGYALVPEDDVLLRDYVVRAPVIVGPSPIVGSIPLRPGSVVPGDVPLTPFTDAQKPGLRRYSYFVAPGDKIVVVDPATRVVTRILDR